ncbi:hypothetical protein [Corynebacterium alimapuense]|uniref:Secreted protein n=1 Tax=Corynebacterium alimapuense TaxID=1576874 RepID=A0A3M8K4H4_9CORY|nr:hypothetical protein [Corynebacterium alimapuense]RNE48117.1 hypothetical protein C5L39_09575 [Corynebacterium alimapuense]
MKWRVHGLAVATALCLSTPAWLALPALAAPTPQSPTDPEVASQWANPAIRAEVPTDQDGQQLIGLELIEADDLATAEIEPGQPLTLKLAITNYADAAISDISLQARRADTAWTTSQARRTLSFDISDYSQLGATQQLLEPIAPGESREVSITTPTAIDATDSLRLSPDTVQAMMIALSGNLESGDYNGNQLLATERMLVSVGDSDPDEPTIAEDAEAVVTPDEQIPGLGLIYPLSATVDIVPGETGTAPEEAPLILASEQLAGQLAPGGRLDELLSVYRTATTTGSGATELNESSCLAIDPALVDTVERMSQGYTVSETRPSRTPTAQRLRDSWNSTDASESGEQGSGVDDAQRWLEQLRETAAQGCILALPWANADLNAVGATANQWLYREALERGPATLQLILGTTPTGNIVVPGSGYITEQAALGLGWADQSQSEILEKGMSGAWETDAATHTSQDSDDTEDSSLESTDTPAENTVTPPEPASTVSVLVSDNSIWQMPTADRFASLAPGINGVTFQGSLGALLAATGPNPSTVGYSDPVARFDYRLDSVTSRAISAGAALRLSVAEETFPGDWAQTAQPVLAIAPTDLDPTTASVLLDTTSDLLADDRASALPIDVAVTPTPQQQAELDSQPLTAGGSGVERFGSPYSDPTSISDTEILSASQQARYTDDLTRMTVNSSGIALSRYGFTLPLRRDILTALSGTYRNSIGTHDEAVDNSNQLLDDNRETLQDLRGSVALIPPGNVYTRASESSPLLIVAENGLPLPVTAELAYSGPEGAYITVPEQVSIPANGSITVQMTAELPADQDQTQLTLWLSTLDGAPISTPVDITVQTRAGIVSTYGIGLLIVVGLALALLFRFGRRRRAQRRTRS